MSPRSTLPHGSSHKNASAARYTTGRQLMKDTYVRGYMELADLETAHKFIESGLPDAKRKVIEERTPFPPGLEIWQAFIKADGTAYETEEEWLTHVSNRNHATALTTMKASIFVLAYSVLDGMVTEYLRVAALTDYTDFARYYSSKQVALEKLNTMSLEEVHYEIVSALIEEWDRRLSICQRIERLYAICQPGPDAKGIDRDRLEKLTVVRNEIIHGTGIQTPLEETEGVTDFFIRTQFILMDLLKSRYDLHIESWHD